MISTKTRLTVCDNSGAKEIETIRVIGGAGRYAHIGDVIVATVKTAAPKSLIPAGQIVRALVVRTRRPFRRRDGSLIRFDDNAAVIISKEGALVGTRVVGPVPKELRERGFPKILSMASEVV